LQVDVTLAVAKVLGNLSRRNFHSRVSLLILHCCRELSANTAVL
jgi:hypothetical protein